MSSCQNTDIAYRNNKFAGGYGRFAPSPTGYMHLGNLCAALVSYLDAKALGAGWLVRIEDIDTQRCKPHFADALLNDLEWLGLTPDAEPIFQSQRTDIYADALRTLTNRGLTYLSYSNRAESLESLAIDAPQERPLESPPQKQESVYPRSPSVRFRSPDIEDVYEDLRYGTQRRNVAQSVRDPVLRRSDGLWGYQLACPLDDALTGITIVSRGADLIPSAHLQRALLKSLGYQPPQYAHFPIIRSQGVRMAKRNGATYTVRYYRNTLGLTKEQILARVATAMRILPPERTETSLDELLNTHSVAALGIGDIEI